MAYVITGPVDLGTTATQTNIIGNISMPDVGIPAQGNVFYLDAALHVAALAPSTSGFVLATQGAGANPIWVDATVPYPTLIGFMARKTGTQGPVTATTATVITNWSTAAAPEFNTITGFDGTTGVFTVPTTAKYTVDAGLSFMNSSNAFTRVFSVRVNGTDVARRSWQPTGDILAQQNANISIPLSLTVGDTVDLVFSRTGAGISTITVGATPDTWFGVMKMS